MKYFMLVVIIAYIALNQDVSSYRLSEKEKSIKLGIECLNETQADAVVVSEAFRHGTFPEDEKLNKYFLCLFKKIGFINEAGQFDSEKSSELVARMTAQAGPMIAACTKESQGNGIANAVHLAKCLHETLKATNNI